MLQLQASHLNRILACNGSINMGGSDELPPNVETFNEAAREGTAMHEVMRDFLTGGMSPLECVDRKMTNGIYITAEMADSIERVTDPIVTRHIQGETETNVDWETGNVFVAGRADFAAYDPETLTLYIDDAKFGWRLVEVDGNWTLLAYAIGWIKRHNIMPLTIVMTIHQPRPYHEDGKSREWRLSMAEFMHWQSQLEAKLASLNDLLNTGPHCYKCPSLSFCPAARSAGMNGIDVSQQLFRSTLSDGDLSFTLESLERAGDHIASLIDAYKELGLHRVKSGKVIQGYAIENPLGHRFWKKGLAPELIEALTGKVLTVKKMVTPAEAERQGIDAATLETLTARAHTGEKLKRKSDKAARKAFNKKD